MKAQEVIEMFGGQLVDVMRMTPGATSAHVVIGWLPPSNPHTNIVEVINHTFGEDVDESTKQSTKLLLEQVGLGMQTSQPVVIDNVTLTNGQHHGFAVDGDVVVACISDSKLFTFDFCARMAENITIVSEAA